MSEKIGDNLRYKTPAVKNYTFIKKLLNHDNNYNFSLQIHEEYCYLIILIFLHLPKPRHREPTQKNQNYIFSKLLNHDSVFKILFMKARRTK